MYDVVEKPRIEPLYIAAGALGLLNGARAGGVGTNELPTAALGLPELFLIPSGDLALVRLLLPVVSEDRLVLGELEQG